MPKRSRKPINVANLFMPLGILITILGAVSMGLHYLSDDPAPVFSGQRAFVLVVGIITLLFGLFGKRGGGGDSDRT